MIQELRIRWNDHLERIGLAGGRRIVKDTGGVLCDHDWIGCYDLSRIFYDLLYPLAVIQHCHQVSVEVNRSAVLRGDEAEKITFGARRNRHGRESFAPGLDRRHLLDNVVRTTSRLCRNRRCLMTAEDRDRFV